MQNKCKRGQDRSKKCSGEVLLAYLGGRPKLMFSRGGAGEYGYLTNKYPALKASYLCPSSFLSIIFLAVHLRFAT
jgi:hypothetical protein